MVEVPGPAAASTTGRTDRPPAEVEAAAEAVEVVVVEAEEEEEVFLLWARRTEAQMSAMRVAAALVAE